MVRILQELNMYRIAKQTTESDVYRHKIMTCKVGPCTERVKVPTQITTVSPLYSNPVTSTYCSNSASDREGLGPYKVVVSTAAFHAGVRGFPFPGLDGLKETQMFLPHPLIKRSIVGSSIVSRGQCHLTYLISRCSSL